MNPGSFRNANHTYFTEEELTEGFGPLDKGRELYDEAMENFREKSAEGLHKFSIW